MKPVCFMVMPFRTKPVTNAKEGAPKELDCDRLWDAAFRPALEDLHFLPVRADLEPGSVIVKDMFNRLKHADLVLADVSLPNGNVYYEVGIRHVAKETRCVLIAADWFKPLFDIDHVRTLTYPLKDGRISDDEAAVIRSLLVEKLPPLIDSTTPFHELVAESVEDAFNDEAERISAFQAQLATVRLMPAGDARTARLDELVREYSTTAQVVSEVALELLYLIRDAGDWEGVRDFVESLPGPVRRTETIQEQHYLAISQLGEHEAAIAGVQQLIGRFGATPERCGIIGGRFKRLYRDARKRREEEGLQKPAADERGHLKEAIRYYQQGMKLDLNEYYCACNLPALLRDRGKKGDPERADAIDTLVVTACRLAEERGSRDPWLPDTLFGTAFRRGDVAVLDDIVEEIEAGTPWRLGSTLRDAEAWIQQAPDGQRRELAEILERVREASNQRRTER